MAGPQERGHAGQKRSALLSPDDAGFAANALREAQTAPNLSRAMTRVTERGVRDQAGRQKFETSSPSSPFASRESPIPGAARQGRRAQRTVKPLAGSAGQHRPSS